MFGSGKEKVREFTQGDMRHLEEIYRFLKISPRFPRVCYPAAVLIARLGYDLYEGKFHMDCSVWETPAHNEFTKDVPHWWSQDRRGKRIELSGVQFNHKLKKERFSEGVVILEKRDPLSKRYRFGNNRSGVDLKATVLAEYLLMPEIQIHEFLDRTAPYSCSPFKL
jgi:hypothetical protein